MTVDLGRVQALQAEIIRLIAGNVHDVMEGEWDDREWVRLFVDFEWQEGQRSSITFALAHRPRQPLEKVSFRLPREAKMKLVELAEAMTPAGQTPWTTARLHIDRDGRFEMETFHVPPRRLGGELIDKRFEDYLERYIAKHGDTPPAKARPWWKSVFGG